MNEDDYQRVLNFDSKDNKNEDLTSNQQQIQIIADTDEYQRIEE